MTSAEFDRLATYVRGARSRTVRAAHMLASGSRDASEAYRWLIGAEAARLLNDLQIATEVLVPLLNDDDDYVPDYRDAAKKIASDLRRKELAPKLANTEGRTAEEAAAFNRKAEEVRR